MLFRRENPVNPLMEESVREAYRELMGKVRELDPSQQDDLNAIFMDLGHDRYWFEQIGGNYANPSELDWLKTCAEAYSRATKQRVSIIDGWPVTPQYEK